MDEKDLILVKAVNANHLAADQQTELTSVLKLAKQDSFLHADDDAVVRAGEHRIAIVYDQTVVGFYSPRRQLMNGQTHWRAGALFLLPSHRGGGIMSQVLQQFFTEYTPGLAWIDDTNTSSIALFTKLGFVLGKAHRAANGGTGHWYVLDRVKSPSLTLEQRPAFLKW